MPSVGVFAVIFDEDGRVLCVKQNYGPRRWTCPGGAMESSESPVDTLVREVREETGYLVRPDILIGVYSVPAKDDLVLCFHATIIEREAWTADGEIAAVGFFAPNELPEPFSPRGRLRIEDAVAGRSGVVRIFESDQT